MTQAKAGGSADQNTATSAGVKPTNATAQHKDTHAAASSNQTKRYGNGQTAGQIAIQNGAPPNTMLHGPGNSQPHKAVLCPGSKHEVDVHALKAKGQQKKCGTSSTSTTHVSSNQASVHVSGGVAGATAGAAPTTQGGVLGATAAQSQPAGGVLGAIESVGQGVLPFTGIPLWIAVLIAVALIAFGLALQRGARATV